MGKLELGRGPFLVRYFGDRLGLQRRRDVGDPDIGSSRTSLGPSGKATKIAVFSEPDLGCGTPAVHSPVVVGTDGNVYFYQCTPAGYTLKSQVGAGVDLSTDLVVGTDANLYVWTGFWTLYEAAPWGTDTRIGAWKNGVFMMPSAGNFTAFIAPHP